MAQLHTAKTSKRVKIMERSLWSARYVFAENLLRSKKMVCYVVACCLMLALGVHGLVLVRLYTLVALEASMN